MKNNTIFCEFGELEENNMHLHYQIQFWTISSASGLYGKGSLGEPLWECSNEADEMKDGPRHLEMQTRDRMHTEPLSLVP